MRMQNRFSNILAVLLLLPIAGAASASVDKPSRGFVTVEFEFDNGETFRAEAEDFWHRPTAFADEPQALCNPPYLGRLEHARPLETGGKVQVFYRLEFNDYGVNRPIIELLSDAPVTQDNPTGLIKSLIAVDLRADSRPEDIQKWLPDGEPVRQGQDWYMNMRWDFEPAKVPQGDVLSQIRKNPDKDIETALPKWLDPKTGALTEVSVTRVRVHADLRIAASYEDPASGEQLACP